MGRLCNVGWRKTGHSAQRQTPLRGEGFGVFVWSSLANARMAAINNVVIAPVGRHGRGHAPATGTGLVQQFVTQPPVEAFNKAVLRRLARRNIVPASLTFIGEGQEPGAVACPKWRAIEGCGRPGFSADRIARFTRPCRACSGLHKTHLFCFCRRDIPDGC